MKVTKLAVEHLLTHATMMSGLLKLVVSPNGCAGYQYSLSPFFFYDEVDSQLVYEKFENLSIGYMPDYKSFVDSLTIDLKTDELGLKTIIFNNDQVDWCGCNTSFNNKILK